MARFDRQTSSSLAWGLAATLSLGCAGLGCVGSVSNPRGSRGDDPSNPSDPSHPGGKGEPGGPTGPGVGTPAPATPPGPGVPGPAVFRRLTRAEYNNTVRDLLGDTTSPADGFPNDSLSGQSGYTRGGAVSGVDADRIFEATDKLATAAVATRLGTLLPCGQAPSAEADQEKCANDFITRFGKRAYRRALTSGEATALLGLYKTQRAEVKNDFPGAIRVVLSAMLLSPNFLYRWETVTENIVHDGAFLRFNGYELASRLSYGLWASMPDDGLFDAADRNALQTGDQIEAQVRRMLKDPKARDAYADFVIQWLDVADLRDQTKSTDYPNYTPAVAAAMLAESKQFIANLMQEGDGKLSTLFTSKVSFIDAGLAKLYQTPGVTGTNLTQTELNGAQRGGILTHGSFLAGHAKAAESGPVQRGKAIADRILCKDLPPPPDDVPPPKPPLDGVTTRQRFEDHSSSPCAAACHSVLDPLGFAFENYDAVGQWRTMDSGKPVNAAAAVMIDGKMRSYANAIELGTILATSKEAADCMAKQWLRYTLRRHEVMGDDAAIATTQDAFAKSSNDLRELIVALTKTKSFTHRTASAGELLP
jgi:hypothetical protein